MASKPLRAEDSTIRRALSILENRFKLHSPVLASNSTAGNYLRLLLAGKPREEFWALWLDARNALIEAEMLFVGTLCSTEVHPREIVKAALRHNAASVIFAHNHPSGNPDPSAADETLTRALSAALSLIDVRMLDHFVITAAEARSMAGRKPRRK